MPGGLCWCEFEQDWCEVLSRSVLVPTKKYSQFLSQHRSVLFDFFSVCFCVFLLFLILSLQVLILSSTVRLQR